VKSVPGIGDRFLNVEKSASELRVTGTQTSMIDMLPKKTGPRELKVCPLTRVGAELIFCMMNIQ